LPAKSKALDELVKLVAQHGLQPYLLHSGALVAVINSKGRPVLSNPAFRALQRTLPKATALKDFLPSSARVEFGQWFEQARRKGAVRRRQLDLGSKSGRNRYNCLLVPLEDGRLLFFAGPASVVSDLARQNQRLTKQLERLKAELGEARLALENRRTELQAVLAQAKEISNTDSLTFLPNRRQIIADLQRQVMTSERYGTPLTVSMLDLDHFKQVNDTYGHATGDDVLRFVAMQLRDHIRLPDMIGRYGGEEFLVILPSSTLKAASEQAERLCQQVRSAPILSGKHVIHITVSIGIAQYRVHEEDWRKLLKRADEALYQAKNNGRDRWAISEA
jgi:diguanylate cyclase (GGDEF)-like protein